MMSSHKLFAVLGNPVSHSLSPLMHNAAFSATGFRGLYLARQVSVDQLKAALEGLRILGFSGANLTVPLKSAVVSMLDVKDTDVGIVGAANTLVINEDRTISGYNTDIYGLRRDFQEAGVAMHGKRAVVLGAGGAARAAVVALAQEGAHSVVVAARNLAQARTLVASIEPHVPTCSLSSASFPSELFRLFTSTDVVLQATSATLSSRQGLEFVAQLPFGVLPPSAFLYDLVYAREGETAFVAQARRHNLRAVDGRGMLVYQGAQAFHLWTGIQPPVEVMTKALQANPSNQEVVEPKTDISPC